MSDRAAIERTLDEWLREQRGCEGTHRGRGEPGCPKERHHHHDYRCPKTVVLVGCCGPKMTHDVEAEELYRSRLFCAARALAKAWGRSWAILSAKHGLVMPRRVLKPYELSLRDLAAGARHGWRLGLAQDLEFTWPGSKFILLAGHEYSPATTTDYPRERVALAADRVLEPMAGLGIGQRLAWLSSRTSRTTPEDE